MTTCILEQFIQFFLILEYIWLLKVFNKKILNFWEHIEKNVLFECYFEWTTDENVITSASHVKTKKLECKYLHHFYNSLGQQFYNEVRSSIV